MAIVNTVYTVSITSANADAALVPATPDFIMASLLVTNTNDNDTVVSVKLADGNGSRLSWIVYQEVIAAGESKTLDLRSLNVPAQSYQLLVNSTLVGVDFTASGGVKTS